jgi:hypothetical protein
VVQLADIREVVGILTPAAITEVLTKVADLSNPPPV